MTNGTRILALAAAMLFAAPWLDAHAHGFSNGTLSIAHPYALPTPPGATTGAGYLKEIVNAGPVADVLVGASSPAFDRVVFHSMSMDGDVMRMRPVAAIEVGAGAHVSMSPGGGAHLMLVGVHQALKVGDRIPLTLQFERAGRIDVTLIVQARAPASAEGVAGSEPGHSHASKAP